MPIRLPHETKGGVFSEGETFLQLIEHLRLASEASFHIGHHRHEQGDALSGESLLQFGRTLENFTKIATVLATSKGTLKQ